MSIVHGRRVKFSARRFCPKCKVTTDQICCGISSRQSEKSEDIDIVTRMWACQTCGSNYEQTLEVPMPSEGSMIFRRLMKVTDDYYVKGTSVSAKGFHVVLDVELYPFEVEPVIRIIEKLEKNQYITVLELEQLRKAGLRRIYDREKFLKRPLWPKTKEEIRERLYKIRPFLKYQR